MLTWLSSFIGKLFVLAGALVMSQMPLFMQYYTQQLAGRVAELQWQVEGISLMAAQSNKSLNQYVHKFLASDDPDFKQQGEFMQDTIGRCRDFSVSLTTLQQASVWTKPFVFLQNVNWSIVKATYVSYEPGLTLNIEGGIFVMIGMGLGSAVFYLLRQFFNLIFRFFRRLMTNRVETKGT